MLGINPVVLLALAAIAGLAMGEVWRVMLRRMHFPKWFEVVYTGLHSVVFIGSCFIPVVPVAPAYFGAWLLGYWRPAVVRALATTFRR